MKWNKMKWNSINIVNKMRLTVSCSFFQYGLPGNAYKGLAGMTQTTYDGIIEK